MPGTITSSTVEIEFVSGTWTDVSAYLVGEDAMGGQRGRPSEFEDAAAATWSLILRNDDGRFTPDNPTSPYYPNVTRRKRIRVKLVKGSTYTRHVGYITAWDVSFPDDDSTTGVVTVSSLDVLSVMDTRILDSDWVEQGRRNARVNSTWSDAFIATGVGTQTLELRNAGWMVSGTPAGRLTLVPSKLSTVPTYDFETPDDLFIEGNVVLTPDTSTHVGYVLKYVPGGTVQNLDLWIKVPSGSGSVPITGTYGVMDLWAGTSALASIRIRNNGGAAALALYDSTSTLLATFPVNGVTNGNIADDTWHRLTVQTNGTTLTTSDVFLDGVGYVGNSFDLRTLTRAYVGGGLTANSDGKQKDCTTLRVAGFGALGYRQGISVSYARTGQTCTASARWGEIAGYLQDMIPSAMLWGSDNRTIARKSIIGRSALDVMQEVALTTGGVFYCEPDGTRTVLYQPDNVRPATPGITLDLEADVEGSPQATSSVDSVPTSVTVTCPSGTITVGSTVDVGRNDSIDTCAQNTDNAALPGQQRLVASTRLRISQITVDLTDAANDLWASFLDPSVLFPTQRIRITGLPSAVFGYTWTDVYVQGWNEQHTVRSSVFTLDCSPADAPVEGRYDDATFGRYSAGSTMTVTGGTCVGSTGTGTLVVTTSGTNPTLSTSAGSYPMDLDWNGERVTITSAPASSVSPQTVTVTARGVAPSVARTHAAGETLDVWSSAAYAI